jgi:deoxyribose-phosphate aldolase
VKPYAIPMAVELLAESGVAVGTVIGFPHGSAATDVKAWEAKAACIDGAREIDMVVNIGKVLSGEWRYVADDIRTVVDTAHTYSAIAKVIFETDFLPTDDLKIELCRICSQIGADFVKTSTGFGYVPRPQGGFHSLGARPGDITLMRQHCSPNVRVKAAGGIRNLADARRFVELGAERIGTSATARIAEEERSGKCSAIAAEGY